ncbi:MAG: SPOR domain-containing protein [Paraprevotella sp.]|nr:SPOR domain-containing protein [Paraprevotella sp.]
MKKLVVLGLCVGTVVALSSCKSKESAYKRAYEEARNKQTTVVEENPVQQQTPVEVTPLVPSTQNPVDVSNVPVRTENVTVISGAGLKAYSVVCGSFGVKANAERLQGTLAGAGYAAQIVYNAGINMYRVVASTYADKGAAVQSRDVLRAQYPDAWLLCTK